MMWVATVTLHDRNGEALHTIRYGAMPADSCESLGSLLTSLRHRHASV